MYLFDRESQTKTSWSWTPISSKAEPGMRLSQKADLKGDSDGASSTQWMRKGSFGMPGFVKLVHPQLSCLRKVLCLPGQPLFCCKGMLYPFRWVCACCTGKKWECIYTFMNIFKLQSTREREEGAWYHSPEIGELGYRQDPVSIPKTAYAFYVKWALQKMKLQVILPVTVSSICFCWFTGIWLMCFKIALR